MNNTCFAFPTAVPGNPAWVSDPSCRGTFGIISLCLSTTIICIWSSVHRDIPLARLSAFRSLLQDAPLALVALFAPEVLFYFALNQFLCARKLVQVASESGIFKVCSGDEDYDASEQILRKCSRHEFTLVHGFYATMGGFAFSTSSEDRNRRAKLTFRGVQVVMKGQPDLIPDLSLTSITDRSKSTNLGKAVLIVQVLWFCVGCASRLTQRLPLSLLELSTVAHGFFTLLSYAMWWHKPLSVLEPTWISPKPEHRYILENFTVDTSAGSGGATYDAVPRFSDLFWNTGIQAFGGLYDGQAYDYIVTSVIPFIYGLLHFLGGNSQFPTVIEQRLWRVASVVVMLSGVIFALEEWLSTILLERTRSFKWQRIIKATDSVVAYHIIPVVYSLGAAYLLVQSIRQLW